MWIRALAVLLLTAASCSAPRPRDPADIFGSDAAIAVFRPESESEKRAVIDEVRFLMENYGYEPAGSLRDYRGLKDMLDREDLLEKIRGEPALAFGARLPQIGYRFEPTDVHPLLIASEGPTGRALAGPELMPMLNGLLAEDLLHEEAAEDLLDLSPKRLDALITLARRGDAASRVRSFGGGLSYRFRPADAAALLREEGKGLGTADDAFIAELLEFLKVEARPGFLPELRDLATRQAETRDLLDLARSAKIEFRGAASVLVLARLSRDHRPFTDAERDRFDALVRRTVWPKESDFLHLIPLARVRGIEEVIDTLEDRHQYRFRTRDSRALIRLRREGVPSPRLPAWIEKDRVPLRRPDLLLSKQPAEAFAPPNDLAFLEALAGPRPDLAAKPLHRLTSEVKARLSGRRVRYRLGAPYTEAADDLTHFLRPDLLKVLLLLDALDRPGTVGRLRGWMLGDAEDKGSERGGYVRLSAAGRLEFDLLEQPVSSGRDDRLLLSPEPLGAAVEFHYHAGDEDESDFAGPSSGGPGTDVFRARRHRLDGLVLTRLPDREFDADFYSDRGFVLDLGIYP